MSIEDTLAFVEKYFLDILAFLEKPKNLPVFLLTAITGQNMRSLTAEFKFWIPVCGLISEISRNFEIEN